MAQDDALKPQDPAPGNGAAQSRPHHGRAFLRLRFIRDVLDVWYQLPDAYGGAHRIQAVVERWNRLRGKAPGGRWTPATVRDLSVHGVGLVAGAPVASGTRLAVELHNHDQFRASGHVLPARVVRCEPLGADRWLLGCDFEEELDVERDLQALL